MDQIIVVALLMFVIGTVVGFRVGNWWADIARARATMSRIWHGRSDHRGKR